MCRDGTRIFQSGSWDPHVRPNWGPSIFWGSQNLGDPLREKEYVLNYEKKRVTNLELILTHMHRTGRQRLFLEPLHSFLDKNSVNERAPFPRVYASLVSSLRSNEQ